LVGAYGFNTGNWPWAQYRNWKVKKDDPEEQLWLLGKSLETIIAAV